jgi:hypothetical protein
MCVVASLEHQGSVGDSLAIAFWWVNGNFAQLADVFTPNCFCYLNDNDYYLVLVLNSLTESDDGHAIFM